MSRSNSTVLPMLIVVFFLGCAGNGDESNAETKNSDSSVPKRSSPRTTPDTSGDSKSEKTLPKASGRIVVSKETTYLEGPLKEDGTVDYVAALNELSGKGITPENNAAVLYWQAFGPGKIPEEHREQLFKLLGVELPPLEGDYFVSLDEFLRREKGKLSYDEAYDLLPKLRTRPWTAEEYPEIAAWLKANEGALELIIEGSSRARFYIPLVGETLAKSVTVPAAMDLRWAIRGLAARAMMRLEKQGAEAAWEDLSACLRISRHYARHGNSMVQLLRGIAFAAITDESCRGLASYADIPIDLQRRMDRELLNFGSFDVSNTMYVFERCMILQWLSDLLLQEGPTPGGDLSIFPELARLHDPARPLDVNEALRVANDYFDKLTRIKSIDGYSAKAAAFADLEEESEKRFGGDNATNLLEHAPKVVKLIMSGETPKERGARAGAMLFNLASAAWSAQFTARQRGNDNWQLTRLTFALAAYRTQKGHYPDTLARINPKFVTTVGKSAFTGEDFYYQRLDPTFVLATAGPHQTKNVPKIARELGVSYDHRVSHEAKQRLTESGFDIEEYRVRGDRTRVTDEELRRIARIPTVEQISLYAAEVTDDGLKWLAHLPRLTDLSLYGTQDISANGLNELCDLQRLEHFFLAAGDISDAGLRPISSLANLKYLDVSSTRITDVGLKHLAKAKNLTYLDIRKTGVSDEAVRQLKLVLPNCEVDYGQNRQNP